MLPLAVWLTIRHYNEDKKSLNLEKLPHESGRTAEHSNLFYIL